MSDKCVVLARQWIQSCTNSSEKHIKCLRPIVPYLPTRVIDVGKSDQDIRLHISSPEQASYYTTLSHSWGEQTPERTTLSRLDEYTVHIPTRYRKRLRTPFPSQERLIFRTYGSMHSVSSRISRFIGFTKLEKWRLPTLILSGDLCRCSNRQLRSFLNHPARTPSPAKSIPYSIADKNGIDTKYCIHVRKKGARGQELPFQHRWT